MASKFYFSLNAIKPQKSTAQGSLTSVTSKEVPGFVKISFQNLKLNKNSSFDPIWHPNANKIGYVVKGSVMISMRTPKSNEIFQASQGEMFFIPRGYVHYIANMNDSGSEIIFALDGTQPELMQLTKASFSLSNEVFQQTLHTKPEFFEGLKKAKKDDFFKTVSKLPSSCSSSRYKFNIAKSKKTITTKGGYLQVGTKPNLETLDGLAILGFGLTPNGAVEPHWHTNAGELVYIVKGHTQITVLSPDGSVEVMDVKGGEGAFAPASHFHNILNVGKDDVEVIAFFNSEDPDYIGFGEVVGSYSNEMLGSIFNVAPNYFDQFKKPTGPLVIVPV